MTPKAFYAGVKRLRPTIREAQRTVREGVKDVFLGIRLAESSVTPITSPSEHALFNGEVVNDDH